MYAQKMHHNSAYIQCSDVIACFSRKENVRSSEIQFSRNKYHTLALKEEESIAVKDNYVDMVAGSKPSSSF